MGDLLYPYQIPHVNALVEILDTKPSALDLSDPGTGKTYTTAAICKRLNRQAFVVAPKAVVESWFDVLSVFDVDILGIANYESIRIGKYYPSLDMFLDDKRVECPFLQRRNDTYEWNLPADTLFIFDEAHKGKNNITLNSTLMLSLNPLLEAGRLKMLILSATITDNIKNFHTAAVLLQLAQEGRHAYNAWVRATVATHRVGDEPEIAAIHRAIYPSHSARMRIRDLQASEDEVIAHIFKENNIQAIVDDIDPAKEAEIAHAYEEIDAALAALKTKQAHDIHPLVIMQRARQRIEMIKVASLIEHAMEWLLNDYNVAIFVNYSDTINLLFKPLDKFVQDEFQSFITFIRGGQDSRDRKYNRDSFNSDASRLIICNSRAGGVGLSLHARAGKRKRVSLISPPPTGWELKQIFGRIHRAGASSGSEQRVMYCRGKAQPVLAGDGKTNDTTFLDESKRRKGVEELLAEELNKKLRTIEWLNNGDEVDYTPV